MNIPIFLSSDENYAPYFGVLAYSLLSNTDAFIEFNVLDGGIEKKTKGKIKKTLKKFKNFSLTYHDMSKYSLNQFPNIKHYSLNTFSRYFIPQIAPNMEKVIYMDIDTIVCGDIAEFYKIEIGDFALAGIPEDFYMLNGIYCHEHIEPAFSDTVKYFNAGVMLLNVSKFVKNNWTKTLTEMTVKYFDKLATADQDIFNILFEKDKKLVDYKFNYMPDFYDKYNALSDGLGDRLEKEAILLHYTAGKPWKDRVNVRRSEDFWMNAKLTPFYWDLLNSFYKNTYPTVKTNAYLFGLFRLKDSYFWNLVRELNVNKFYYKKNEYKQGRYIISILGVPVLKLK